MKLWSALLREESFPLRSRLHPAHHPFQTEVQSYQPGRDHRWRAPGRCEHSRRNGSLFSAANTDAAGKPRCFNFWRRGACRNPACRFAHVSRGASSDPLHARGVFPLTLRCLPSRCACRIGYASCTGDAQSIRGASSGPLHARGVFPL